MSGALCLCGLHGRADGRLQPADLEAIRASKIEAVKLLSTAAPEDVPALRAINPGMFIVVRLFADLSDRRASPADFVSWVQDGARKFHDQGVRYFEVHNEPNLTHEGWQRSWNNGYEFGGWFLEVCRLLRYLFPAIKLGWPGLSPGGALPIRRPEALFLEEAAAAVSAADWIGCHCYWLNAADMDGEGGGRSYALYQRRYPNKPKLITEFSNPNPQVGAAERGQQYVRYYQQLAEEPDIQAAFAFLVSGSAFAVEAWRREDGSQTEVPLQVGRRALISGGVSQVANYKVTAGGLNVRSRPWLAAPEPDVVGYLNQNQVVAVYQFQQGWGSLDTAGTRWVNLAYTVKVVEPISTPVITPVPVPPPAKPALVSSDCPTGKGILIWNPAETAGQMAAKAVQMAVAAKFQWVSLKIADGTQSYPYNGKDALTLRSMVLAFQAAGLKVHGWHYVRGDDPVGEAKIAVSRLRDLQLDGYQIDAEPEYTRPGKAKQAVTFMRALREGTDTLVGLCSYRFPDSHRDLPWAEFLAGCDYHAPQVYPMGQTSATAFGVQLRESVKQLLKRAQLPVVPIGPAYRDKYTPLPSASNPNPQPIWWEPTVAQINDFHATARALNLPGEGWYSWQAAEGRAEWWQAIAAHAV